jgi:hypothetical protein
MVWVCHLSLDLVVIDVSWPFLVFGIGWVVFGLSLEVKQRRCADRGPICGA